MFSCLQILEALDRKSGSAGMPRPISYAVFCLKKKTTELEFGPDGTALVQEFVESQDGAIVRVEVLDDRYLYAIRIVRPASDFNLCPADICRVPEAPASADLSACPVETKPGLQVTRYDAPPDVVDQARALARAASIDVGGIEYLVGRDDGRVYFYDVNATSNFVANAPAVLGFDPFPAPADYLVRV